VSTVTAERLALATEVARLRAAPFSLTHRVIGNRLGISTSYASELDCDPDGAKTRARKDSYRRPCPNCGKLMDGSNGRNGPKLCKDCAAAAQHEARFWTRERIIQAIQEWAAEHGKPPSARDWLHVGPMHRWPNYGSVYGDAGAPFATWADAIVAAGYPRPLPTFSGKWGERVWTEERTLQALREWAAQHGRSPVISDWRHAGEGRPTSHWVQLLFGSWNEGLRRAGLPTYELPKWSRSLIIAAIERWALEHGEPPRSREWDCIGEYWPSKGTVRMHFGSWNLAIEAAGFAPRHKRIAA